MALRKLSAVNVNISKLSTRTYLEFSLADCGASGNKIDLFAFTFLILIYISNFSHFPPKSARFCISD